MAKKEDFFTKRWQMKARIKERYDNIAKGVGKCVFCDLKPKYIVAEDSGLVLTVNLFPYITGHLLVIPKRHIENYLDLTPKEVMTSHRLIKKGLRLLRDVLEIENVWLLLREGNQVGKTVKHLHWQIMPYIEGIVSWHYQKVGLAPEELAEILRKKNGPKKKNKEV